jgi:hypothetical protein
LQLVPQSLVPSWHLEHLLLQAHEQRLPPHKVPVQNVMLERLMLADENE